MAAAYGGGDVTVINTGSVSRRELRHALMRRRNERIAADRHADGMPVVLRMHPDTAWALLADPDPNERFTVDDEGRTFLGIPIQTHPEVVLWAVEVDWPSA